MTPPKATPDTKVASAHSIGPEPLAASDERLKTVAEINAIADDPQSRPDVKRLARAVLQLFRLHSQNRENNLDAFSQIEELGKRKESDG